jgi:hypothetical protein
MSGAGGPEIAEARRDGLRSGYEPWPEWLLGFPVLQVRQEGRRTGD